MLTLIPQEHGSEAPPPVAESAEFEIVMGRRQIASILFVGTVMVVAFSAVSYLAGKTASPRQVLAAQVAPRVVAAPAPVPTKPFPPPQSAPKQEAPLFAQPVAGALYIQSGAVEKGVATVIAEGLRTHGLEAFVAPGPSEKIFRVLIGPLADSAAYTHAKATIDEIGLDTFARRYQAEQQQAAR